VCCDSVSLLVLGIFLEDSYWRFLIDRCPNSPYCSLVSRWPPSPKVRPADWRQKSLSALVKLLLFSLTVLSALSLAASPMAALNHQSVIVATMSLGSVPIRSELLEVGGASIRHSWIGTRHEGVGIPDVALFSGSFAGPVTWTLTTLSNGTQHYTVAGVFINAVGALPVNGARVQLVSNTETGSSAGLTTASNGYSYIGSVPEPSVLVMVGTGLLGVLIKARQKFS